MTINADLSNHTTDLWYYHASMAHPQLLTTLLPSNDGPANYCPQERCYTITGQILQWSSDSRYVIFLSAPDARNVDLYAINLTSGQMRQLTFTYTQKHDVVLLPDGIGVHFCEFKSAMEEGPCYLIHSYLAKHISITEDNSNVPYNHPNWKAVIDGYEFERHITDSTPAS